MRKLTMLCIIALILQVSVVRSQRVGINENGSLPDPSAMLDVKSSTKGVLIPRLALSATNQAAPFTVPITNSTLVYNTANQPGPFAVSPGFYYWEGGMWVRIATGTGGGSSNAWSLNGNAGTSANDFIGTIDDQPLIFKAFNAFAGKISHAGGLNTSFGFQSGANITGTNNTALGYKALRDNTGGSGNTAIGTSALANNNGNHNTATGDAALFTNTGGINNTATGYAALSLNTIGGANTATGFSSMSKNGIGINNTAMGAHSLQDNIEGSYNTAVGVSALRANIAYNNVAVGYQALQLNNNGSSNTAVGFNSLQGNFNGLNNTAVGVGSLQANNDGGYNTAAGSLALTKNNGGSLNTAFGAAALADNESGGQNTAVGYAALSTSTGGNNAALGAYALQHNGAGSNNTAVGVSAGVHVESVLDNATAIGYAAKVNASNTVQIGNSDVTDVYFGNPNTTVLHANSLNTTSDARFKYNIKTDVPGLTFITKLAPVTYYLDDDKLDEFTKIGMLNKSSASAVSYTEPKKLHSGFLAQDVEKTVKELGYEFDGLHAPTSNKDHYSLSYASFVVPLVKAVQEQQVLIDIQKDELKKLKAQVELLTKAIQTLSTNK